MSKRILSIILFSWLSMAASTAFAQQKTDTADTFRFVPQEDTFYLTREDNPQESVQSLSPTITQLSLRANLLRWATLTPDLGLEWRICPSWGIAVNGSWTSWSWNDKDRRYALWEVVPELRYYIGKEKARLPRRDVQGRTVQLQALHDRQTGRPYGWRHHRRLSTEIEQMPFRWTSP